jgi:hypothetical protein
MPWYIGPAAVVAALVLCGLLMWWMERVESRPGRKVTVSLVDGAVLSGRTRLAWPGRIRLAEVATQDGEVPGVVIVHTRNVITVQVTA